MKSIEQTVILPDYFPVLKAWTKQAYEVTLKVSRFLDFAHLFFNRSSLDCRVWKDGAPVDGKFMEASEYSLRNKIFKGSVEERIKGFFVSEARDDGTDSSVHLRGDIQPYTISTDISKDLVFSTEKAHIEGMYVSNPCELSYQAWMAQLDVGPCASIFILEGYPGPECATFFFPIRQGGRKDCYLLIGVDSRYMGIQAFFFEGDPEVYANQRKRSPRTDEIRSYNRNNWPAQEAPVVLPLTYKNGSWVEPRPIQVRDVNLAFSFLKASPEKYLYGGG